MFSSIDSMGQAYHSLPSADDLAGLGQRFHDDTIVIRFQLRMAACITGNVGLGFRRIELGFGRIRCRLDLVVSRCGNCARAAQVAVAGFILRRLLRPCLCSGDRPPAVPARQVSDRQGRSS